MKSGVALEGGRGVTAPLSGNLSPPHRVKLNNSLGDEVHEGNFKYSCFFSQTGRRKNELSALNVNNKKFYEKIRGNVKTNKNAN